MSAFSTPEPTPTPHDPMTFADVADAAENQGLPPGGLLDLDDALAEALAAVEAVEARVHQDALDTQTTGLPEAMPPDEPQPPVPPHLEIRGMPTISSSEARAHLAEQVRDLTIDLTEARHRHDRDEKEIDQLIADLSVTRKRYHKLGAEHDDLRKRLQRAELELPDQGSRSVLNAFLAPLDHLVEVFEHLTRRENLSPEGQEAMTMLQQQWQRAFAVLQVTPFDALGQPYDAQVHEYIASAPSDAPVGQVIRQVGRGYLLGGRLLRSARVVVSAGLRGTTPIGGEQAAYDPEESP